MPALKCLDQTIHLLKSFGRFPLHSGYCATGAEMYHPIHLEKKVDVGGEEAGLLAAFVGASGWSSRSGWRHLGALTRHRAAD